MPKLDLPPPIPDWLKPVLKRSISGEAKPDTMDFQVVSAALAGVELDALKKRFDLGAEEIVKAIRRVACAVRGRAVDKDVLDEYPDLRTLQRKEVAKPKAGPKSIKDREEERALAVIDTSSLPEIIPGNDKSLHEFLVAAKALYAREIVKDTFEAMRENVKSLDGMVSNMAVAKSLETFYGVGRRGPGVAIQQNFGEGSNGQKSDETPHFFEQVILEAEVADGSGGGEQTVFDERLLGQQDQEEL